MKPASLRDSPKPWLDIVYLFKVPVKSPEAKLKGGCEGEGHFTGNNLTYIRHQQIWR
jgi:hypothetical protein